MENISYDVLLVDLPYAKAADDGLFFVKDYIAVNGHQGVYTLVTPKGKALFLSMLGEIA